MAGCLHSLPLRGGKKKGSKGKSFLPQKERRAIFGDVKSFGSHYYVLELWWGGFFPTFRSKKKKKKEKGVVEGKAGGKRSICHTEVWAERKKKKRKKNYANLFRKGG